MENINGEKIINKNICSTVKVGGKYSIYKSVNHYE